jgi:di/tricarboxylate transporter
MGLVKTGVIDVIGRRLHRISGGPEFRLTVLVMLVAAACAAVMKNTTTTAMFVPVVLGLCERTHVPPSKPMMPLAFGAILGGTCTLIGTSTNLAVSGALPRYNMQPFTMFELTPVGVAMEKTHAEQYLANIIRHIGEPYGGLAVLAGFFLMTVALTQPMSNQAALVMLPIAVKTALALRLNPRAFAITVTY